MKRIVFASSTLLLFACGGMPEPLEVDTGFVARRDSGNGNEDASMGNGNDASMGNGNDASMGNDNDASMGMGNMDGGMGRPDGSMGPPDGSMGPPDGGMGPPDGSMGPPDGGMGMGMGNMDGGMGMGNMDGGMGGMDSGNSDSGADAGSSDGCTLADNTSNVSITPTGCILLSRDTTSCMQQRMALGLSGFWLKFSCRVGITTTMVMGNQVVQMTADSQPDYHSNYFQTTHACWENYTPSSMNPNRISARSVVMNVPRTPNNNMAAMPGGGVGLALNGVLMFNNSANPPDDIYDEASTFDRCQAHPQQNGVYHYHSEPYSITNDDSNFVGVLRDGYPVYGRRDMDGTVATGLDAAGAHTGTTIDSPSTPVYHHHINLQTHPTPGDGRTEWFITTGTYGGTAASCNGC